jgi:hypothetical protein
MMRFLAGVVIGAFRRSELVALNVDDLEETAEGMLVTLHRSKTDQEGLGCPFTAKILRCAWPTTAKLMVATNPL